MSQAGHFRAHGRLQVDLPASLYQPPGEAPRPIRILNLSLGGACVETGEPLELGAWISLEIEAPTLWDPLSLRGRVVWTTTGGDHLPRIGLHFEHREGPLAFALLELLGSRDYEM